MQFFLLHNPKQNLVVIVRYEIRLQINCPINSTKQGWFLRYNFV